VTITILYVILALSTSALVLVGIAMYLRVRRLARASETQFRQALKDAAERHATEHDPERAEAGIAQ